jgi:hypothetical protein
MVNCAVSDNRAEHAGGILNSGGFPTFSNCTIIANVGDLMTGDAVYSDYDGMATFANSIVWGADGPAEVPIFGAAMASYSCIEGGLPGAGNIDAPPWLDHALRPFRGSPCIDAGSNAAVPHDLADVDGDGNTGEPMPLDIEGRWRFHDDAITADTGSGTSPIVDMGANEYGSTIPIVVSADLDHDGDVDLYDHWVFVSQFVGPR